MYSSFIKRQNHSHFQGHMYHMYVGVMIMAKRKLSVTNAKSDANFFWFFLISLNFLSFPSKNSQV